jgi:hypothetical protein
MDLLRTEERVAECKTGRIDHDCDGKTRPISLAHPSVILETRGRSVRLNVKINRRALLARRRTQPSSNEQHDGWLRPLSHEPIFTANSRARETTSSRRKTVMIRDAQWNDVVARSSDRAGRSAQQGTTQIRHGADTSQVSPIGHPICRETYCADRS